MIRLQLVFVLCVFVLLKQTDSISKHPILVIIAFDGFGHDFVNRNKTPIFESLIKNGTTVDYMYNVFPTVTAPNFFSISTGMYPETHGVIGNVVFNEQNECYPRDEDDPRAHEFYHYNKDIIPLWTLNELSGDERFSGVSLWPGTKVPYQGKLPTFSYQNYTIDYQIRVDIAMQWLLDEKTPANLIFMHFNEPDTTSHLFGLDSEKLKVTLDMLNNLIVYFLKLLNEHGLRDRVNFIFLSDHGQVVLRPENVIEPSVFNNRKTNVYCGESPVWQVNVKPEYEAEVYTNFTEVANKSGRFKVYRSKEIPERWHYKGSKRTSDLLLVANFPYFFPDANLYKGDHGFDPAHLEIRPFFIANGPLFKVNFRAEPFNSIDIYPLVQHMLNLTSPPEHVKPNGTFSVIKTILRNEP